jgi:hypothetical protein
LSPRLTIGRAVFGNRRQASWLRIDTAAAFNILVNVDLPDDWPPLTLDIQPQAEHQPFLIGSQSSNWE